MRGTFNMDTEYFSDEEFDQIVSMFYSLNIDTDYFTYEDDFIQYVLNTSSNGLLVYNAAQSERALGENLLYQLFVIFTIFRVQDRMHMLYLYADTNSM